MKGRLVPYFVVFGLMAFVLCACRAPAKQKVSFRSCLEEIETTVDLPEYHARAVEDVSVRMLGVASLALSFSQKAVISLAQENKALSLSGTCNSSELLGQISEIQSAIIGPKLRQSKEVENRCEVAVLKGLLSRVGTVLVEQSIITENDWVGIPEFVSCELRRKYAG